jgi:signal transduction histidine kinase
MHTGPRKILILDDNDIDRETCRRHLARSLTQQYEFFEHNAIDGALELVQEIKPDCILLDYHLHDGNGVEFLQGLADLGGPRTFPVVMLTGTGSESIAVTVMKAGAQDYLVKDRLNPEVLQRAVEGAIYKAQTDRLLDGQRLEMERLFREAQEANARKDQFLAALSHELRTPLTPVLAVVSHPRIGQASPAELREIFAIIRRNIELEARLIDDMLDLTRISRGKLDVDARISDAHGVLRHAVETCEPDLREKGLRLELELSASRHHVLADPARLQQIFWNLLKNAVKFTPAAGAIAIATRDLPGNEIEISVTDTGIGIDPELREKIFDAFEQGHAAITRRYGGLGLGLAISKALVEAHHGTIRAENGEVGARLVVVLPTQAAPLPATPPAPSTNGIRLEKQAKSASVLLVEDHADTALLLGRILELHGYRVHIAHCISQAFGIFQSEAIDCVISDIGLPDGHGTELMTKIAAHRPIPGIALSGFGMEHDVDRSHSAGFSHHLTKPVDWARLEEVLKSVLA